MFSLFRRRLKTLNRVEVSAQNILQNAALFQKLLPQQQILPVLKSNAYGHGLREMGMILQNIDCPYFVVDSYYEALELQKVSNKKSLIIGWNHPQNFKHFNFKKVSIAVYDLESLHALAALKKKISIHLKINTGMNRQGFRPQELEKFLKIFQKNSQLHLEGVFSHFANADGESDEYTEHQQKIFSECLDQIEAAGFRPELIHLGNTAGALKTTDKRINSYRPGLGLYGHNILASQDSFFEKLEDLKPALRVISTVINIIELQKGETVSYNCTFTAPENMRIGIVPVGYYECVPRALSNTGSFRFGNTVLPIVGRVCMNLTCFDMKDTAIKIGTEIEIISMDKSAPNSIPRIAELANTIPYEPLVNIAESIRRVIV